MFTLAFWKDAIERAISTGAQAVLTVLSLDGINFIVMDFNPVTALAAFGFGALYAILKALVAARTGSNATASFTDVTTYKPQF